MTKELLSVLAGKRRAFPLLLELQSRGSLYTEQLVNRDWDRKTVTGLFRIFEKHGLVSSHYEFRGNKGAVKWYQLTEKGTEFLVRLAAADELLEE